MHLFLSYLLNDSQTIRSIHFQVCPGLRTQQVGGQYANVDKLGIIMFIIAAELH